MSRKVCKAGKVGPFSFVIVDTESGTVQASIREDDEEVVKTYPDMESAEKCTDQHLYTMVGQRYEVE